MLTMSFNILCCGAGIYSWENRSKNVIKAIKSVMPDTLGIQEAHEYWMEILKDNLPEYDYVGIGRDDGDKKGEFSPVFYKKDKYELIKSECFFLSDTPDIPGMGWDACCPRTCSYALLRDKNTNEIIAHFNTHLDHKGMTARINGISLILQKISKALPDTSKIILTGDFNDYPDSVVYKEVTDNGFCDARCKAIKTCNLPTFHDYDNTEEFIDYIFLKNISTVKEFDVINKEIDGIYPSDHFPIIAEF